MSAYSCLEAENGARALAQAEKVKPYLVILDLSMKVVNRLEAPPVLRRMLPEISLYGSAVSKKDISALGISAVVSKEESLQKLTSIAHSLIQTQ